MSYSLGKAMQIPVFSVFSECINDILISVSLAYVIVFFGGARGSLASEMRCRVRPYSLVKIYAFLHAKSTFLYK